MTARLWAILHVVSYILIFVIQGALKINAYNPWDFWRLVDGPDGDLLHYTMGIWNILTNTLAIYTMSIAKDLTETRTVSQGDQLCSRWTWWRHGQYPKGVCYMANGPGGRRGSIPRGSAVWFNGPDRGRNSIPRGSAIWSMDRTEKAHEYLLYAYGHWTWRTYEGMGHYTTWCLNNVRWNNWMWCLTGSI